MKAVPRIPMLKLEQCLETTIHFLEQQENSTTADYAVIKKWRDLAALKCIFTARQQLITSYFVRDQ